MTSDKQIAELLKRLNENIETLSKVTALTVRKASLFKGTETKPEQIEILDRIHFPDEIIALIIDSTPESVKRQRRKNRAETKKAEANLLTEIQESSK